MEDKIREYAQWFIESGFEEDVAWQIARLIVKPKQDRTDDENDLVFSSVNKYRENTLKLSKANSYIGKLESDLHLANEYNRLCSGIENVLREKYEDAGYPYGNTDKGFTIWQTELDNINNTRERLEHILKELE